MTRCESFYEKWKRCGNFCEASPETAREIEEYLDFREETGISGISQSAARHLIREKDAEIKARAILAIKKSLETRKELGTGKFAKTNDMISEKQVVSTLAERRDEVKSERGAIEASKVAEAEAVTKKIAEKIEEVAPDAEAAAPVKVNVAEVIRMMVDSECAAAEEGARNQDPEALIEGRMAPKNSLDVTYVQQIIGFIRRPEIINDSSLGEGKKKIASLILTAREAIVDMKCTINERLIQRDAVNVEKETLLTEKARINAMLRGVEKKIQEREGRMNLIDSEIRGIEDSINQQGARVVKLFDEFREAKE